MTSLCFWFLFFSRPGCFLCADLLVVYLFSFLFFLPTVCQTSNEFETDVVATLDQVTGRKRVEIKRLTKDDRNPREARRTVCVHVHAAGPRLALPFVP